MRVRMRKLKRQQRTQESGEGIPTKVRETERMTIRWRKKKQKKKKKKNTTVDKVRGARKAKETGA